MSDQISVLILVPRDEALPVDVQGVGLRRRAIELMQEIAKVNENTIRYKGGSDDCVVQFGAVPARDGSLALATGGHVISTWQYNLLATRWVAKGEAHKDVCGPVTHEDRALRVYSSASVVRDEFA